MRGEECRTSPVMIIIVIVIIIMISSSSSSSRSRSRSRSSSSSSSSSSNIIIDIIIISGSSSIIVSLLHTRPYNLEGIKGSQGMGVESNHWFDRVLLSILYMFQPSC